MNQHQPIASPASLLPAELLRIATLPAWHEFAGKWGRLPENTTPAAQDRQGVLSYCRQVAASLGSSSAEDEPKLRSVAKLCAILAVDGGQSDDLLDVRNLAYLEALSDYPAWAVAQAVRWWIAGEHPGKDERREFVPKPSQLVRLIKLAMAPVAAEQERAGRVLKAIDDAASETPPPSPEEQARVSEKLKALMAEVKLRAMNPAIDMASIPDRPSDYPELSPPTGA